MIEVNKRLILEKAEETQLIRQIVRDIITTYKIESDGTFYLPEDLSNEEEYETEYTSDKSSVSVELTLVESDNVDDFIVNGFFIRKENVVEIKIIYNPNRKKEIIFDLIAELNEVVAHEMRHLYQRDTEMYDLEVDDDREPYDHYSSPEEIDAQVYGFRRMKKITKRPFEQLVRNWFKTHKSIHHLNSDQQEEIIDMILDANSKI